MATFRAKNPNTLIDIMAPKTTRQKWDMWLKNSFNGDDPTYYNRIYGEIEDELPFETEEEHQNWLTQGDTWMGEPGWLDLTNKILKRGEEHDIDTDQLHELKQRFKGKDYNEAMKRLLGGEAYGDILNGLVTYEVYDKVGDKTPSGVFNNEKDAHNHISKQGGSGEIRVKKGE